MKLIAKKLILKFVSLGFIVYCVILYATCSQYAKIIEGSVWELRECDGEKFPVQSSEAGHSNSRHVYIAFDNKGQFYHIDIYKKESGELVEGKTIRRSFPYRASQKQIKLYDTWYNYEKTENVITLDYPRHRSKYEKTQIYTVEEIAKYVENKGKLKKKA